MVIATSKLCSTFVNLKTTVVNGKTSFPLVAKAEIFSAVGCRTMTLLCSRSGKNRSSNLIAAICS